MDSEVKDSKTGKVTIVKKDFPFGINDASMAGLGKSRSGHHEGNNGEQLDVAVPGKNGTTVSDIRYGESKENYSREDTIKLIEAFANSSKIPIGEKVVVYFNDTEVQEKFKNHPNIRVITVNGHHNHLHFRLISEEKFSKGKFTE